MTLRLISENPVDYKDDSNEWQKTEVFVSDEFLWFHPDQWNGVNGMRLWFRSSTGSYYNHFTTCNVLVMPNK